MWWARRDSNPGPTGYEPAALTAELRAHGAPWDLPAPVAAAATAVTAAAAAATTTAAATATDAAATTAAATTTAAEAATAAAEATTAGTATAASTGAEAPRLWLEAVAAVDRAITAGLEGNLRILTAACAGNGEHFAGPAATATRTSAAGIALADAATIWAPARFIGESLGFMEFLLARGEGELRSAVCAG